MTATPSPRPRRRGWLRERLPLLVASLFVFLAAAILLWGNIVIVIRAGEAGVLWNRFTGTRTDWVYSEGLHIISPLDKMYRYEVRQRTVTHELDVLSSEGLTLTLHLAIRFRPDIRLLGLLHEHVGPEFVTTVVEPQTDSILRRQLGVATAEAIYTNRDDLVTRAVVLAIEEMGANFVDVEDIQIRRISLPETVRTAIEDKVRQEELLKSYAFRQQIAEQEAQRRRIEAAGRRDYQETVNASLSERIIVLESIKATQMLLRSDTPKTVVIGEAGSTAFPLLLPLQGAAPIDLPSGRVTPLAEEEDPFGVGPGRDAGRPLGD